MNENISRVIDFLQDKIVKFSEVTEFLSPGGKYYNLIAERRPDITLIDGTDKVDLFKELLVYRKILKTDDLNEFISSKDKDYKRKYMPNLNLFLFGNRSAPSLPELIFILGKDEVQLRIDRAIAELSDSQSSTIE